MNDSLATPDVLDLAKRAECGDPEALAKVRVLFDERDPDIWLEFGDLANEELMEIAYLVTYPDSRTGGFAGAWSVYPYLPSGTIIVSDGTNGLFILSMQ